MDRALAEAGAATMVLNATRHGRPLYQRLGFAPVGTTYTHIGVFTPASGSGGASGASGPGPGASRPAGSDDLAMIRGFDAGVTGADRAAVLERLPAFADEVRVVGDGGVSGYAATWRGAGPAVIGPVQAGALGEAKTLIGELARAVDGPVRLDVDGRHPRLRAWLTEHGVPAVATTELMVRGGPLPGDRDRLFAVLMHALG
jgi:Acetyltransferase (GNAT) domain